MKKTKINVLLIFFNNGLKKKFKRGKLNFSKFKTNAILGRQMN
jgi:hypothetical protein